MIERPDQRTKLLADTVHGDWADGPAADFARRAAAHARRCRRWRRSLKAAGATACLVVAGLALHPPLASPVHEDATPLKHKSPAYEIISDDELLAELRDRPLLALRKENGTREFVFLDH